MKYTFDKRAKKYKQFTKTSKLSTLARDNLVGGKEIDQTSVWDLLSTHNGNTIRLFYIVRRVK